MIIRRGDTGHLVQTIQQALLDNGYELVVDGNFGGNTERIVKLYQQQKGLQIDGKVGRVTFMHLTGVELDKYLGYESAGNSTNESGQLEVVDYGSKRVWLLDNGHGGMINGEYQTSGKRSPQIPPGVYEGVVNRQIVKRIMEYADENGISYCNLVPENQDIKLSERVNRAHKVAKSYPNSVYVSVHCNAFGSTWNNANGIETFFYRDNVENINI